MGAAKDSNRRSRLTALRRFRTARLEMSLTTAQDRADFMVGLARDVTEVVVSARDQLQSQRAARAKERTALHRELATFRSSLSDDVGAALEARSQDRARTRAADKADRRRHVDAILTADFA